MNSILFRSHKIVEQLYMFIDFFYKLKETGVPVSPTAFLTLHKALNKGTCPVAG